MKVIVPVKRVVDYNVKVRVKAEQSGMDLANLKMSMNPFDEIAVEAAVRRNGKRAWPPTSSWSPAVWRSARKGCAGPWPWVPTAEELQPLTVAKLFNALVGKEQPTRVILGQQAIDDDCNQRGQMLAALAGFPQGRLAAKVEVADGAVKVIREVDGGLSLAALQLAKRTGARVIVPSRDDDKLERARALGPEYDQRPGAGRRQARHGCQRRAWRARGV